MKLGAVSGAMLTVLMLSMLPLAFNIQMVKSMWPPHDGREIIYIRADGSVEFHPFCVDPPPTNITSVDNITYTLTDNIVSSDSRASIVVERDNIVIDGAGHSVQYTELIHDVHIGIDLSQRSNVTLKNMEIKKFTHGVNLYKSYNNSIYGNNITSNTRLGISLEFSSNNTVFGNTITNNRLSLAIFGGGVYVASSSSNTISGNNITNNHWYGIFLAESSTNIVSGNNITNNSNDGVYVLGSSNNTISGNTITANNGFGILLEEGSSDNHIYHNNFINNSYSVTRSGANDLDNDYPSGGNYWSKYYTGEDLNGDGIGDTPKVIDESNQDRYPLMSMYPLMSPGEDAEPPVADAGPDQSVVQGMTVTFDASGSTDDVAIRGYAWAFTDVTLKILTRIQPQYTFNNVGDFEVTLNITDFTCKWDTDTMWVHVSADSIPPVANAGSNQTVDPSFFTRDAVLHYEDTFVSFDGSGSTDNIKITSYTWTFMDVTPQTLTGVNLTYTFRTPREYIITLNVTDAAGNWDTDTVRITVLDVATHLTIDLSTSTSYIGFKVNISGRLVDYKNTSIAGSMVLMEYSVTGEEPWSTITADNTTADGSYSAVWMPSATGNYLVRAKWSGNSTIPGTTTTVNLAVTSFEEQSVFSVTSNSTVSELAFNSTSKELGFTVTGPTNTTGYVNVHIAKTLVDNIADVKVYLDGDQLNYTVTSTDDSWLLHFTYHHSTRTITISLAPALFIPPQLITPLSIGILAVALAVATAILIFKIRKGTPPTILNGVFSKSKKPKSLQ